MENLKLVKVEDLKKGDEIIISCYSNLKYLKVLRDPQEKGKGYNNIPYYKSVKCSLKKETQQVGNFSWRVTTFEDDVTKHNEVVYQDLNSRHIFLVKREEQY